MNHNRNTPTSIQTRTGVFFDLAFPRVEDVNLTDLAEHLAKANRYAGATIMPLSVAQHSVLVSRIVERDLNGDELAVKYALLHDAEEAYMGDLTQPLKTALRAFGGESALGRVTSGLRYAVFRAFGLEMPGPLNTASGKAWALVKHADMIALATEKRDCCEHDLDWAHQNLPPPRSHTLTAWPWPKAADEFKRRARELFIRCPGEPLLATLKSQEAPVTMRAPENLAHLQGN